LFSLKVTFRKSKEAGRKKKKREEMADLLVGHFIFSLLLCKRDAIAKVTKVTLDQTRTATISSPNFPQVHGRGGGKSE
jgi:hypothetical protein